MKFLAQVCLTTILAGSVFAEGGWQVKVAPFAQKIKKVKVDSFSSDTGRFIDGTVTTGGTFPANTTYTVADYEKQVAPDGSSVAFHTASIIGSDSVDSSYGFIIEANKSFASTDSWNFALNLSLSLADYDSSLNYGTVLSAYDLSLNPWNGGVPQGNIHTDPNSPALLNVPKSLQPAGKLDVEMFFTTLSVAVQANYSINDFSLYAQFGPTLSFVDSEVSFSGTVSNEDSNSQLVPGLFAAIGAEWQFQPQWGIFTALRYDYAFDDVTTDFVEVELGRSSVQLGVSYSF